jgi:AAA domain
MEIRKASKKKVKLRIGLSGASGFGKTYSALLIAFGITNDWSKVCIIDTENNSADLYANLGEYSVLPLSAPFAPERYVEAIKLAEKSGFEVIIIDSISHEWEGVGGCLEICDQITAASNAKNSYTSWGKITPRHNAFIQSILQSNCHIITTVRRKQDYEMSKDSNGKTQVVKMGMKEITREGFEYELTANLEIVADSHYVKASKDRTQLFMDKPEFVPTIETGKALINWANTGVDEIKYLIESLQNATDRNSGVNLWNANKHLQKEPLIIEAFKEFSVKFPKDEKIGRIYDELNN